MFGKPSTAYRVGQMRQRITIQQSTDTLGTDGYLTRAWSTLWTNVPATFEQVSGGEVRFGKQIQATANALFTIRYLGGITPLTRVSFNSVIYGIVQVNNIDGLNRYLEIQAARSADAA